ncbi:MAG: hypothetical protein ACRED2_04375 [Methylocella sp.]
MRDSPIVKLASVAIIAVVIVILAFFLYDRGRPDCDGLFEQTTARLSGRMEIIHNQGDLVIGREKVQELSDGSQKVALHLKFCCLAQHKGAIVGGEALERCAAGAKDYENKIVQVAASIRDAQSAKDLGNAELAEKKVSVAKAAAAAAISIVPPADRDAPGGKSDVLATVTTSAQEPNNTILQANVAQMGTALSGEISSNDDVDYFRFKYQDDEHRRDVVSVHLENLSTTLQPCLARFNEDKSEASGRQCANAPGANLESSFTAEPGKSYYVVVGSYVGVGNYKLAVTPRKAYDSFEPNNDAFSAAPLGIGQTVEANIMVGDENDWYHLTGITEKSMAVRLENLSTTLQPCLARFNEDKSEANGQQCANAPGANLESSLTAEPGKSYYVVVGSYGGSVGNYKLTVR